MLRMSTSPRPSIKDYLAAAVPAMRDYMTPLVPPESTPDSHEPPTGDAAIVCPHCRKRGFVSTEDVKLKRGISGGKATGAILTAGISLMATGLSRKEWATQASCGNCDSQWLIQ